MMGPSLAGSGKSGVSFLLLLSLGIREDGSFSCSFLVFFNWGGGSRALLILFE